MLTETYTLVALAVEQANVRLSLTTFQAYVHATFLDQPIALPGQIDYARETLKRLYRTCHWRKLEMYLIPAVNNASAQSTRLLAELDALNESARAAQEAIEPCLRDAVSASEEQIRGLCRAVDAFCDALLTRLEKEERELFPLARSIISGEAWFSIANEILSQDARHNELKRSIRIASPCASATRIERRARARAAPSMGVGHRGGGRSAASADVRA